MFIQTEPTPNPTTIKFLTGRVVIKEGTVIYQNEINRSLLTEARGASEAYKGDLAFTTGIAKAAGDIYAHRSDYGSLLS